MATKIAEFQGENRFLSNFYGPNPTVEHRYQAAKAASESDRLWVLEAATPGIAKRRGRRVAMRNDWEQIKLGIMENLVREKFKEPALRTKLLATGDLELVEGNTWGDTFWGVCNGRGENHLGKIIMKVRKELRDANT